MFGKARSGHKGKSPSKGKQQQKGYYKGQEKGAWTAGQEAASGWRGGWHEGGAPAAAEPTAEGGMSRRILAPDAFVKKFLRPYAAADGRVLYGEGSDQDLLQKAQLRALLTPEVSELSRRPCWGMSMAGKSVAGLGVALAIKQGDEARNKLAELLRKEKGQEFLEALDDLDYERHKFAPEDLESKFEAVLAYCKGEKAKLHDLLPQVAAAAAREYVGAMHALDLVVKANALAAWAEQIPDEERLQPYLDAFRDSKVSARKAAEFLVGAYKARKKLEASWKRSAGAVWGDDSDDAPEGPRRSKRKANSTDSSSEATKKKKNGKKDKTKKKKTSSSPSGSSAEEKKKNNKKVKKEKKRKSSSSENSKPEEKADSEEPKDKDDRKKKEEKSKDEKRKKSREKENKAAQEREALEAAYTAWSQSDVAQFIAEASEQTSNMAGRAGAKFELSKLQAFTARIPEALQPYAGESPVFREGDWMDAEEAKGMLTKMLQLAEQAEAFLTAAARAAAGGSAGK